MKYILIFMLALGLSATSFSQYNTGKIYNSPVLKKGFYRNYQEFIHNTPSITDDFTVIDMPAYKKDTTAREVDYAVPGKATRVKYDWGFCDGRNIYIRYTYALATRFWQLECIGPYSFFTYSHRGGIPIGLTVPDIAVAGAASALQKRDFELLVINEKGKFVTPNISRLKKWMASVPDLQDEFMREAGKYEKFDNPNSDEVELPADYAAEMAIIKVYLFKLNRRLGSQDK